MFKGKTPTPVRKLEQGTHLLSNSSSWPINVKMNPLTSALPSSQTHFPTVLWCCVTNTAVVKDIIMSQSSLRDVLVDVPEALNVGFLIETFQRVYHDQFPDDCVVQLRSVDVFVSVLTLPWTYTLSSCDGFGSQRCRII